MRILRAASSCIGGVALACAASAAQADTHATLDVLAGARALENPYLLSGPSTGAVAATFEARPSYEVTSEVSSLKLNGMARYDRYFRRYGDDFAARVDASFERHLSEMTVLRLAGLFDTSQGGSRDLLEPTLGGTTPVLNPTGDASIAGARFRQYNYAGTIGLTSQLSIHDQIEAEATYDVFDPKTPVALAYQQATGFLGYNRVLNERVSVGVRGTYRKTDYRNRVAGDGDVISPEATLTYRASEAWTVTARAGASFVSIKQAVGGSVHSTGFVGNLSLCNQGEQVRTCLVGDRSVSATGLGGVSNTTTVTLQQDWRLSDRDTLALFGSYIANDQLAVSQVQFGNNNGKLARVSAEYRRRLTERLTVSVAPQFEKAWGLAIVRKANYGAAATLQYRFGG